jgi:hypothetical protein
MISSTLPVYVRSPFKSTKYEMEQLTPEQLDLADRIYAEAEKNYDKGGHWIVEATEPWELVKMFPTIEKARAHWELVEDIAKDIQNS